MNGTKKVILALLVIGLLASAGYLVVRRISVVEVIARARAMHHVWWAPIVYIVLYAVCDVLFIPPLPLSIFAAVAWGWLLGGTLELFAAIVGAIFPFLIAQRAAVERRHLSWTVLLVLRLVPVIPYTPLNYAAGLTTIALPQYLLATFIGIIPSTYIFAFFVDSLAAGVVRPRDVFWRIVAAGALLAALVIISRLAASRLRRRGMTDRIARPPGDADHAAE